MLLKHGSVECLGGSVKNITAVISYDSLSESERDIHKKITSCQVNIHTHKHTFYKVKKKFVLTVLSGMIWKR